jgi:hypothetical protein
MLLYHRVGVLGLGLLYQCIYEGEWYWLKTLCGTTSNVNAFIIHGTSSSKRPNEFLFQSCVSEYTEFIGMSRAVRRSAALHGPPWRLSADKLIFMLLLSSQP